jgi:hypothetical protein
MCRVPAGPPAGFLSAECQLHHEAAGPARRLFLFATLLVSINIAGVDRAAEGAVMKIVLRVVGPLFVAVGLFWFAQGTGLLRWPHNAAMVDYGAGIVAVGMGLVWFGWQADPNSCRTLPR